MLDSIFPKKGVEGTTRKIKGNKIKIKGKKSSEGNPFYLMLGVCTSKLKSK